MFEVSQELKDLLVEKLQRIIEQGETITSIRTITSKTTKWNGNDEIIETTERTQTTQHTEIRPTPKWAVDYIRDSISLDHAVEILEREGFSVTIKNADMVRKYFSVENDERSESSNQGLSEETIAAIKRKILGIDN